MEQRAGNGGSEDNWGGVRARYCTMAASKAQGEDGADLLLHPPLWARDY